MYFEIIFPNECEIFEDFFHYNLPLVDYVRIFT